MPEFAVQTLLETPIVAVQDVGCLGSCRHQSAEECATATHLVFPYRGVYVRHLGRDEAVAEANQVLFFNAAEGYRVSHPVPGGDACLSLVISEALLRELAPKALLRDGAGWRFAGSGCASIRARRSWSRCCGTACMQGSPKPLEAESLALTLVRRALGARTSHAAGASTGRQKLVDRAKLVLSTDLARRWTLAEIAAEVGVSPVYLTQVFQQVEGLPLYRYQLRLRLARALDPPRRNMTTSPRWAWISASPATAISAPPSARPTAARRRSSGSRRIVRRR